MSDHPTFWTTVRGKQVKVLVDERGRVYEWDSFWSRFKPMKLSAKDKNRIRLQAMKL